MTTTIDRPGAHGDRPSADESTTGGAPASPSAPTSGGSEVPGARTPTLLLLAVLTACAGLVHLVMVPSHFDASTADGTGFLVAGWVQLVLAVALVARPRRAVVIATAVANAVLVGAWVVAHSVGLPYGAHQGAAETATFVSQATVALEGVALLLAVGLVFQPRLGLAHPRRGLVAVACATVGVLALTSAAIASPSARGHGHGDEAHGGDDHAHGAGAAHSHEVAAPVGNEKAVDDLGYTELANGHQHELPEDFGEPLDARTENLLRQQLSHAYQLQARYPTVADAEADGYRRAGPFAPGLGAHYGKGFDDIASGETVDGPEAAPEVGAPMLIYDGIEPDSPIAGFMYLARSLTDEPEEGFAGNDDVWHYHTDVCITTGPEGIDAPLGADRSATQEECDALGGSLIDQTNYMVHVWSVPGYESRDGLFSDVNPALRCPDGTYFQIPLEEVGLATSTCRYSS